MALAARPVTSLYIDIETGSKFLYRKMSEVDIIFSLKSFFANSLSYHTVKSPRGDLQLLQDCHFIETTGYVLLVFRGASDASL